MEICDHQGTQTNPSVYYSRPHDGKVTAVESDRLSRWSRSEIVTPDLSERWFWRSGKFRRKIKKLDAAFRLNLVPSWLQGWLSESPSLLFYSVLWHLRVLFLSSVRGSSKLWDTPHLFALVSTPVCRQTPPRHPNPFRSIALVVEQRQKDILLWRISVQSKCPPLICLGSIHLDLEKYFGVSFFLIFSVARSLIYM